MNVWVWIVGAAIQSTVSLVVTMLLRRSIHKNSVMLEQVLSGVESVVILQSKGMRMNLREYRKAIALLGGTLLTGLLTWAETANLEPVLGPLVPTEFRPLVGVFLGAIASMAGVILARNEIPTLDNQTPAVEAPAVAAPTIAERRTIASFGGPDTQVPVWAGLTTSDTHNSPTSLVQLQPVPATGN